MEQLIAELYHPSNQSSPERVNAIQREIQQIQRQNSSWQLGLELLRRDEAVVRFYGALTLTIKINADWYVGLSSTPTLFRSFGPFLTHAQGERWNLSRSPDEILSA